MRYAFVDGDSPETTWSDAEKAAFSAATASWAAVANLTFIEVADPADADWIERVTDTAGFVAMGEDEDTLGMHETPDMAADDPNGQLHGWFNREGYGWPDGGMGWAPEGLVAGGYGFETFVHEIGHGLGLAHPHDRGGGSSIMPGVQYPFGDYGDRDLNQTVYTVMSYNRGFRKQDPVGSHRVEPGYEEGPAPIDVAAVQVLYGARAQVNDGDDTYRLTESGPWQTIWDTGGTDEIVYDGSLDAHINLIPLRLDFEAGYRNEGLSYLDSYYDEGGYTGGFTLAGDYTSLLNNDNGFEGVLIENASGGRGGDTIIGNDAANVLRGNEAGDQIYGGGGDDQLFGGPGADSLRSGTGNDYLNGGRGFDLLLAGEGDDILIGGAGHDNLQAFSGQDELRGGKGGDSLRGGTGDDQLWGGGGRDRMEGEEDNDRLMGGAGRDRLQGGAGDDWLIGGPGRDVLIGGTGEDTFEFAGNFGRDRIVRFEDDRDTLVLDHALWGGGMSKAKVLRTFATEHSGHVTFDFGHGEAILITGIKNLSDLRDDLVII
ncbi:MAG TPA: hypothetical protein ENK63_05510 [Rhodobacterales bacterium]|nr:hypothetical protein [Rhodobacterales bacterium]